MAEQRQILLEQADLCRTIGRMAHEIIEKTGSPGGLVLIGIRSRGVHLARRHGMRVIGPNCMGLLNTAPSVRLNATFSPVYPPSSCFGYRKIGSSLRS